MSRPHIIKRLGLWWCFDKVGHAGGGCGNTPQEAWRKYVISRRNLSIA